VVKIEPPSENEVGNYLLKVLKQIFIKIKKQKKLK